MGRPVDGMDDEIRDWIIDFGDGGCMTRYRLDAVQVIILEVWRQ